MDLSNNKIFWENRYSSAEDTWSGAVNEQLKNFVQDLKPGSALDIGCGEGGDSLWLAKNGWNVTAVDISQNAINKVDKKAKKIKITNIKTETHEIPNSFPIGKFDLVIAMYFHSPEEFSRLEALKKAAEAVQINGMLLIVGHADLPPGIKAPHPIPKFDTAEETYANLNLKNDNWTKIFIGKKSRKKVMPNGDSIDIDDSIVAIKRIR